MVPSKNSDNASNGRRSMNYAESSDDEDPAPTDRIRVGRDYQAVCPELIPENLRKPELLCESSLMLWSPTVDIPDSKLEDYILLAKDKYGYNWEQALGILCYHNHDLKRATVELARFIPLCDEWSVEDKNVFENAYKFHGKRFNRIRQLLPEKSVASLVKYYYTWKKNRPKACQLDKQARKLAMASAGSARSETGSVRGATKSKQEEKRNAQPKRKKTQ